MDYASRSRRQGWHRHRILTGATRGTIEPSTRDCLRRTFLQPQVLLGIKGYRPVRKLLPEREEPAQSQLVSSIRRPQLLVRHVDKRALHFPDVPCRKSPIALHQGTQV